MVLIPLQQATCALEYLRTVTPYLLAAMIPILKASVHFKRAERRSSGDVALASMRGVEIHLESCRSFKLQV